MAQAGIANEVAGEGFPVVSFGYFNPIATTPQGDHLVIIARHEQTKCGFRLHIPIRAYTDYGMNLSALKTNLRRNPSNHVLFVLPDGHPIPAAFHVTEVGQVTKTFVDCGGTVRRVETCLLQAWVSEMDPDHRLTAEKLANILDLSAQILPSEDHEVEVEYEPCAVAQYQVEGAELVDDQLRFQLVHKHTDCLAREACSLSPAGAGCGCSDSEGKCC